MFNAFEMQAFEKELKNEKWYSINRLILIASKTNDYGQKKRVEYSKKGKLDLDVPFCNIIQIFLSKA